MIGEGHTVGFWGDDNVQLLGLGGYSCTTLCNHSLKCLICGLTTDNSLSSPVRGRLHT